MATPFFDLKRPPRPRELFQIQQAEQPRVEDGWIPAKSKSRERWKQKEKWREVENHPKEEEKYAHVIWDWDNRTLPPGYDIKILSGQLQKALYKYDEKLHLQTFIASGSFYGLCLDEKLDEETKLDIKVQRKKFLERSDAIQEFIVEPRTRNCNGCPLIQHQQDFGQDKYSRLMDVGDAVLSREMKFVFSRFHTGVMVLISEDQDFVPSLAYLVERGWKVIVVEAENRPVSFLMRNFSRAIYVWEDMIRGDGPRDTQVDPDEDFVKNWQQYMFRD